LCTLAPLLTPYAEFTSLKELAVHQPDRTLKDYLFVMLKGLCMGAADVVPGVSGGTIAFITGIYDEWLSSLKRCTPAVLLRLKREGFVKTWQYINGNFLLALFGGILISLKTFAAIVLMAMDSYPILVWAFFSGLVAASIYLLVREQRGWGVAEFIGLVLGIAFILAISLMAPAQLPGHGWILFLGGFVAICAMILPGISGSFILLLVGLYPVFLQAIHNLEIVKLLWFGAGCITGLVVFSRFLLWLLNSYHSQTLAVLIGFLVGSLYVTWPWKNALLTTTNSDGKTVVLQQENLNPLNYLSVTGTEPTIGLALLWAFLGVALVIGVEMIALWIKRRQAAPAAI
jgi:putative membrane protein